MRNNFCRDTTVDILELHPGWLENQFSIIFIFLGRFQIFLFIYTSIS